MHYCLGINGTVLLGEEQRIPSCYKELLRIDSKAIRLTLCTSSPKMQWVDFNKFLL